MAVSWAQKLLKVTVASQDPDALAAGLMLESALGTDLERFGDYQTRLVKLNPKLAEGAALAVSTTGTIPAPAAPVTAPSGIALSGTALSATALSDTALSSVPPANQTDATTPGASHTFCSSFSC